MKFHLKTFDELTLNEFHSILKLRIDVFVVEQNCPYAELDSKDSKALHLFAYAEDDPTTIVAYTRIFKPGDYYKEAAFGRVVVHADHRKKQLGRALVEKTITVIRERLNSTTVKIGAQTYLKHFYQSFGFKQIGAEYLEDGIPHIYMQLH